MGMKKGSFTSPIIKVGYEVATHVECLDVTRRDLALIWKNKKKEKKKRKKKRKLTLRVLN